MGETRPFKQVLSVRITSRCCAVYIPVIMNQDPPPKAYSHVFLMLRSFPGCSIPVKTKAVCKSHSASSVDNITSDLSNRPSHQVKERRVHSRNSRHHKVVLQGSDCQVPGKCKVRPWTAHHKVSKSAYVPHLLTEVFQWLYVLMRQRRKQRPAYCSASFGELLQNSKAAAYMSQTSADETLCRSRFHMSWKVVSSIIGKQGYSCWKYLRARVSW
jgi:hypothetical protein